MLTLHLVREPPTEHGVFGRLECGPIAFYTVEDDWKQNARGESCIPAGVYPLRRTIYHRHGYETFEVGDVPDRSRILIHPANTEEDVMGCIGVGMRRGKLWVEDEDDPAHPRVLKEAVVESRLAFRRFMDFMSGTDEARLSVHWQHVPEGDPA